MTTTWEDPPDPPTRPPVRRPSELAGVNSPAPVTWALACELLALGEAS